MMINYANQIRSTTPGSHPQEGKLLGASQNEIVLGLKNGIRLHFPRLGYIVKKA
jgi:hypothetical protein